MKTKQKHTHVMMVLAMTMLEKDERVAGVVKGVKWMFCVRAQITVHCFQCNATRFVALK